MIASLDTQENRIDQIQESDNSIEKLAQYGIQNSDITKLRSAGICTVECLIMTTKRTLLKIKGLSESKIDKLKEISKSISTSINTDFISAKAVCIKRQSVVKFSTGSTDFDNLLQGGIETMSITEIFGEFRTGKTQLCMTLCVTTQLQSMTDDSNISYKIAFIDTEHTFRPDRLKEISLRFSADPDAILNNIIYARAYNSDHQFDLLDQLSQKFSQDRNFKLLIIDSIINLFRTDFIGRGELNERQQKLNLFLNKLQKLAEEFNIAVVVTNQMMSDPSATLSFVSDPKKPIGGHVMAHACTTRIYLRKGKGDQRIAKIYDSPEIAENEAVFSITAGGVDNADD